MLHLCDRGNFRGNEDDLLLSYPSVLNDVGAGGAVLRNEEVDLSDGTFKKTFRDLPRCGRRSPRSALFCHIAEGQYSTPSVYGLSSAEFCLNFDDCYFSDSSSGYEKTFFNEQVHDVFDDEQLSSDSDLNELLRDEPMSYNRLSGIMGELRDGPKKARKADILQGVGITPEVRAQWFMDYRCDIDDDEENFVKSSVLAHFAAGGSSNSVILDAHVEERENQFLAAEAEDEAAEDLCYALERLREGMEEYETIVRRVSQHAASIPFVCSLLSCALSVVPARVPRLVPASAYAGQPASHCKLFADWYITGSTQMFAGP
jgi:hypothetical protein